MKMSPGIRDKILAAIPTDRFVSIPEIHEQVRPTARATVQNYLTQMKSDGWLVTEGRASATLYKKIWADTFFKPRPLPTVIWVGEDAIVGPFCEHCGWTEVAHGGPLSRCPAKRSILL